MRKLIAYILVLTTYIGFVSQSAVPTRAQAVSKAMQNKLNDVPGGLTFRLSEGKPDAGNPEVPEPANAKPLSPGDTGDLLKRVPEIKPDTGDQTDFARRAGSLPAPKTGAKLPVKFPSDDMRGTPKVEWGKTLSVLRYSPEGEISLAPDLSVTFSQPMVAVTSQEQASQFTPVEFSPQVEGRWRWLGTKTLMFDTDKRFPMATRFTARVPAGTRSATGEVLAKEVRWTFTTPPAKVETMIPNGGITRRNALMYLQFDQAIDPGAMLKSVTAVGGGKRLDLRLATQAEVDADYAISAQSKMAQPGRWLAFRAVGPDGSAENALPGASTISVTVNKGAPSAEGPLTTTAAQSFSFQTYSPLKMAAAYCNYFRSQQPCTPYDNWLVEFNNPLDTTSFDPAKLVRIEPAVEGLKIFPSGNYIYIQGYKPGQKTYKITVDGEVKDVFGQKLGASATASIKVDSAPQDLSAQGGSMVVLDPNAKQAFSIFSTNHSALKVRLYAVEPKDWYQFQQYQRRLNYDDGQRPAIPGRLVSDEVVNVAAKQDEMVETRIGLSKAFPGGYGSVIVDVEPTVKRNKDDRSRIFSWVQSTDIGLDAFVDNQELVGFATELRTGKPLAGVDLEIYPNGTGQLAPGSTAEAGVFDKLWNWFTGAGGPSDGTSGIDADGEAAHFETVEPSASTRTGANGLLRLALPAERSAKEQNVLIARRGQDVAFLPENTEYYWQEGGNWYQKPSGSTLTWYVFDDRKMYKPNEEVSVKGYVRLLDQSKLGDVMPFSAMTGYDKVGYIVSDPRGAEIAKGTVPVNAFGAFDLKTKLPDNVNLGYASIQLRLLAPGETEFTSNAMYNHQFRIQEFRRPEFEVTAKVESEGPFFVGGSANVGVEAKYYAGGGLPNADTTWTVTASQTSYTPPNRGDYTFGTWTPWWRLYDYGDFGRGYRGAGSSQTFSSKTDASGKHLLKIDFDSVKPARPYTLTASAAVMDVNRQTWSGATSLLVHPSSLYIGIKTSRTFVQKGEKIVIDSIVTDLDGNLQGGRDAEIKAVLKDWIFEKGSWTEKVIDEQFCMVKTEAGGPSKCEFISRQGGRYSITATVMDDRERFNESELTVWVPGGKQPPKRSVEQEEVQIIPSKKDFAPGETAELLVIAPFTPAEGVLTLRRNGLVKTERFTMKDSSITLKVPLLESYLPNITAQVDLVGVSQRTNDKGEIDPKLVPRPAYASGNIALSISTESRRLTVEAEPANKTLAPGSETNVTVAVKDSRGEPVADTEVALVVVDESVLALSGYSIPDPLAYFYPARDGGVSDYHSRKDVLLGNPVDLRDRKETTNSPPSPVSFRSSLSMTANGRAVAKMSAGVMNGAEITADNAFVIDGQEVDAGGVPIALRQNFAALALFSPTVKTDSNGKAVVPFKLPDNLTRYRITAVAADAGKRFGKSESNITAKQPLMVRPSAPRFMNFGDKAELPVVIQNQTESDMTVNVAVRATNANLSAQAGSTPAVQSGQSVVIKANDRAELRFPVSTVKAGTARFQFVATAGKFSDAAEISLPVWTPATTEAFATYGTTDQNGAIIQPIETPGDVFPQFGGLEITTSSTQLQELTDAYIYLANYPYECSEQIASRMISTAALKDVLSAFKAKDMPSKEKLEARFARDIQILKSRQRDDGSFGLWMQDQERYKYPFLTVHVAHALVLAKAKGYKVPDEMLNRTRPYLRTIEKQFDEWHKSQHVRWTISAYALYVRDLMGDSDVGKAKKLLAEMRGAGSTGGSEKAVDGSFGKAPFEALGWILSMLAGDKGSQAEVAEILAFLNNRTTETAATANFVTDYGDGAWLIMASNRRADGVLLEAMIRADVKNDLIPKLVRGLLDHRVKGAWSNTQENVFILLALDKYFNAFEKVTPDFVTRIWLGSTYAGEQVFKGRSIDSNQLNIPMSYLFGGNPDGSLSGGLDVNRSASTNLIIDRQGAGRLYYRIGMKYAPKNLKLEPADYGFTVLRKYEPIDKADDVRQNADGSWTIRSGSRVRVRLTMVAQARRYHVALVDPLPAGLEILNPELRTTEAIPQDEGNSVVTEFGSRSYGRGWWWTRYWFEHQNFRDERAEAFSSLLWEGVYQYTYVTRATTPGQFVVPPAKAEEMYHPETFGRTGTDLVRVE